MILEIVIIIVLIFLITRCNTNVIEQENYSNDNIVLYYADWCGHCKQFMPEWENAANQLGSKIRFTKINCVNDKKRCENESIKGFPTVILYRNGKKMEFNGERTVDGLKKFIE